MKINLYLFAGSRKLGSTRSWRTATAGRGHQQDIQADAGRVSPRDVAHLQPDQELLQPGQRVHLSELQQLVSDRSCAKQINKSSNTHLSTQNNCLAISQVTSSANPERRHSFRNVVAIVE